MKAECDCPIVCAGRRKEEPQMNTDETQIRKRRAVSYRLSALSEKERARVWLTARRKEEPQMNTDETQISKRRAVSYRLSALSEKERARVWLTAELKADRTATCISYLCFICVNLWPALALILNSENGSARSSRNLESIFHFRPRVRMFCNGLAEPRHRAPGLHRAC
jgi:hypothetical protein